MFVRRGRGARVERKTARYFECLEDRLALSATPTVAGIAVSSTQWSPAFIAKLGGDISGYSIPVGSSAQTAALSWSNIDQIKIKFSEDVIVQVTDLSLSGKNVTNYEFASFFYDPGSKIATWTLAAPLAKDRLLIDLDGDGIDPIKDLDGNVLDGNWINNSDTFASAGDGFAGGDFEFLLNVLPGEVNSTSQVTNLDYMYVNNQVGLDTNSASYNPKYDIDGSGVIDASDRSFVQAKFGDALPTGNPAGVSNDAPTASPFGSVTISNAAVDEVISLWSKFGDAENGATGLTYSIGGNTAASLFDSVSINSSTGQLVLNAKANASGISKITVVATDAGGIATRSTFTVGVGISNQAPHLAVELPEYLENDTWLIRGYVTDDQDVTGLIVVFFGAVDARAAVYPDGSFQVVLHNVDEFYADEWAATFDLLGTPSNNVYTPIGMS